jgi:hypothetical protein
MRKEGVSLMSINPLWIHKFGDHVFIFLAHFFSESPLGTKLFYWGKVRIGEKYKFWEKFSFNFFGDGVPNFDFGDVSARWTAWAMLEFLKSVFANHRWGSIQEGCSQE